MSANATPVSPTARTRLREQQKREQELLAAVLAADARLDVQRSKHVRAVARADEELAAVLTQRDECVSLLIGAAGKVRTAALLDLSPAEVARLLRACGGRAEGLEPNASGRR